MNSILKNTILGVCTIGLLAGCASKDVEYDDTNTKKVVQPVEKSAYESTIESTKVGSKAEGISGTDEQAVSDNADTTTTNSLTAVTNSGVYSVESDINVKTILLDSVHFAFDYYYL
jgi:hypothetical protein